MHLALALLCVAGAPTIRTMSISSITVGSKVIAVDHIPLDKLKGCCNNESYELGIPKGTPGRVREMRAADVGLMLGPNEDCYARLAERDFERYFKERL